MKIKTYITFVICAGILVSCNSSSSEDTTTTPTPINVPTTADTTPVVNTPVTNPATQAPVVNTVNQQLNPAHGQPGHRCDIAEGAPLNSAPPKTTVTPAVVQPQNVTVTPTTVPAPSANPSPASTSGLNPAHGQPGHRCDIAVGAPLNSKPTTQPETVVQKVPLGPAEEVKATPIVTPATPVKSDAAAPAVTTTAPGMNPAHGQPGHRCDIAVGAPLNSAPKKN